jgi:hypothetical protein
VLPGGGFVAELAAVEADVEDADPAVGKPPQRLAVSLPRGDGQTSVPIAGG